MTHGIPDAERLESLLDEMNSAYHDVQELDERIEKLGFDRVRAYTRWKQKEREYETFKSALAGQKDGRYA